MQDPFGRDVTYLRVSVTDRCDFRCVYCMAEDMTFLPKKDVLSLEELDRLCGAFVRLGVRKLRLTGGEPLVRRHIMSLIRGLARHLESGALDELTLVVELEEPTGYFPNLLTSAATYPLPRHVVDLHGERWTDVEHIVTNGPFKLESWQQGQRLVLTRNAG